MGSGEEGDEDAPLLVSLLPHDADYFVDDSDDESEGGRLDGAAPMDLDLEGHTAADSCVHGGSNADGAPERTEGEGVATATGIPATTCFRP